MNRAIFWVTSCLLLLLLGTGIWSCAYHDFSWDEYVRKADAPNPEDAEGYFKETFSTPMNSESSRCNEKLQQALALYKKHNYTKAYKQFVQVVLETDDPELQDKALLGAALSDLLILQANEDITQKLPDLELLFSNFQGPRNHFSYELLEPFLLKLVELRQQSLSYQSLRAESRSQSQKIETLRKETTRLRQQVEELEALFQKLEQQKRQPVTPGATN
ncbi:hypothetical protein SAMN05660653_02232 [Desulfonatronum thiosulfatophilum]|uniref:Uncharacterized protein n=1 Tax=Desulfonatronum thiosulfatophilum TaxID=617002 RepID=A0A1G6DKJ0_9BACT|nr:hypothetical protein [Desulfonatronum thiosulfatophilum]SDB45707.1 hypothetical protein SAMN05660653_02232 [Desulfonatronum thiosulfatophilum]